MLSTFSCAYQPSVWLLWRNVYLGPLPTLKNICLLIYLTVPGLGCGMWDLVPWPRVELRSPALGAQNLNHDWVVWFFFFFLILSDITIAIPVFFCLLFAWNICFHSFTFNLFVSLVLRWVSCRKHIVESYVFIHFPVSVFWLGCLIHLHLIIGEGIIQSKMWLKVEVAFLVPMRNFWVYWGRGESFYLDINGKDAGSWTTYGHLNYK